MLCDLRPRIAVFENVTGLFTTNNGRFFARVLQDITESGYDCEWKVVSAASVGAPHQRKRVWIVAYSESVRRKEKNKKNGYARKNCTEKPEDWIKLQSISAGAYHIHNWKNYEHILAGNYDGLPETMDRIKGAGNAIVPQVAEVIFNLPAFDLWRE